MKKIVRFTLIFTFVLTTVNWIFNNLSFTSSPLTQLKVALIIAIFEIILKPIVKILLLPINLLTLGLFRIVINTLGLYLAIFLISDFGVGDVIFSSPLPQTRLSGFVAFLATSILISFLFHLYRLILTKTIKK